MTVLITGGSGLVGSRLTELLIKKGISVRHLSRRPSSKSEFEVYEWNISTGYIQSGALDNVDVIIHLAGTNVAEKRWSQKQKESIIDSRTRSTELLKAKLEETQNKVKLVVSASGVGIYGVDTDNKLMYETDPKGDGFLADVVDKWEQSVDLFQGSMDRIVKLRIGVVLDKTGGALSKILPPIKMGIGSPLGSGDQYMSCIHIDDLCNMIMWIIDNNSVDGVFNAVCDDPITNAQLTRLIAEILGKPLFMPNVPSFVLKSLLGEMSSIVVGGNRVSNKKITEAGFEFNYPSTQAALNQILTNN